MRCLVPVLTLAAMALCTTACQQHLFFVEGSSIGLKAKFSGDGPSPAEVDLGYRRGLVAIMPKRVDTKDAPATSKPLDTAVVAGAPPSEIVIEDDPAELMSLYTAFRASVGFGDPTEICHFLASGRAAALLVSNQTALEQLSTNLCAYEVEKKDGK